ncbi:tRNA (adenosine(37)-N6)-threonylcarbamoyltransferase complex dimerization subunit type 1 TsaB [Pseudohongiella spirulinae]|uniref:tRNA threonylcarbamoyladenosine biosynthesis protein TsaB n=1 Tax=Pseudohongiella spirulinae TaxID=1249552 RepID=A0A0S2KE16_9GAMM|nr:tRNA (adenosine(37)-N6)-threonylcarbamoyltransferase complex dimerization subunit type 1 TsaB [Pseudohongiella spirulinae]ALO46239.1 hypothetical protein PS2015_1586 [Pseudohongiella spirulinae]
MIPRILAIDTSAALCSVALHNGVQQFFNTSVNTRRHADDLLAMVQGLLAESGLTLSDLDAIAVVSGPGSFTGLRIGLAVAQGLAFGSDKGIITVSALAMLARCAASQLQSTQSSFAALMAAREQEYYLGVYQDALGQFPNCLLADQVIDADDVRAALQGVPVGQLVFAGSDWRSLGIENSLECLPDARVLLSLAIQQFEKTGTIAPELAALSYLKEELPYRTVEHQ